MIFARTLFLLAFCFLTFSSTGSAFAELGALSPYVEKYRRVNITDEQLQRLSAYSHLITYFSDFAFFKPNHKVSPYFIKALILAESNCTPYAVSPKNALGLGQILPETGKKAAGELYRSGRPFRYIDRSRLNNLQDEDLFDPAINILLTCYLISKYNYRFNGQLDLVVSAWNAGENVDSLKIGKPAPYSETYNLIGKINGYYLDLLEKTPSRYNLRLSNQAAE